jgi:hypothetical protein
VIDRLRMWLNRPLTDGDRKRLFVLAVAAILAAAGALALLDDQPTSPSQRSPATPARPSPEPGTPLTVTPTTVPSEEGQPSAAVRAPRADVEGVKRAARRFLAGYLPYTYGRQSARRIRAATSRLRRRLAARPPRVPARVGHRRPRVLLVQAEGAGRARAAITALISDGARRYSVELELARGRSGWQVTDVGD